MEIACLDPAHACNMHGLDPVTTYMPDIVQGESSAVLQALSNGVENLTVNIL